MTKHKYKYLGKKVEDIGREGLDRIEEYKAIADAIINEYRAGKISEKTARGRLLLLYRLTFKKNNSKIARYSASTLARVRKYIQEKMRTLDEIAAKRKRR